jgi:hypothetical protein
VCTERHLPAVGVGGVGKVVVAQRIGTERGIVVIASKSQRSAGTPAADELRGEQLALVLGPGVRVQEAVERSDLRLVLAQPDVRAVAAEDVGLR